MVRIEIALTETDLFSIPEDFAMNSKRLLSVTFVWLCFAAAAPALRAQDGGYGFGGWSGFGGNPGWWNQPAFGVAGSLYGSGYVPVPPYFSIHPPVYYSSRIIYRPMGDSPFAYLPRRSLAAPVAYRESDAMEVAEPEMIENPYVQSTTGLAATKSASATRSQPKMILNPFVEPRSNNSDDYLVRFPRSDRTN